MNLVDFGVDGLPKNKVDDLFRAFRNLGNSLFHDGFFRGGNFAGNLILDFERAIDSGIGLFKI